MNVSTASPPGDPLAGLLGSLFSGTSIAAQEGIDDARLEGLYDHACDLVERGDFESALGAFLQLVTWTPYEFRFQFGRGLCLQQLGEPLDALQPLGLAWFLDPTDAGCAFRLGECHVALGNRDAAVEAFETAIDLCVPPGNHSQVRVLAEQALDRLNAGN